MAVKVTFSFVENGVLVVFDEKDVFVFEDGPEGEQLGRSKSIVHALWHVFQDWCQTTNQGGIILGWAEGGRDVDH